MDREKNVTPIHPKETDIEGLTPAKSLAELTDPTKTSISVVTPPKVSPALFETRPTLTPLCR